MIDSKILEYLLEYLPDEIRVYFVGIILFGTVFFGFYRMAMSFKKSISESIIQQNIALNPTALSMQQSRIKELESKVDALTDKLTEVTVSSEQNLSKITANMDKVNSENKTLRLRLTNLERKQAEDLRTIKGLETENKALRSEISELKSRYKNAIAYTVNEELGTGDL